MSCLKKLFLLVLCLVMIPGLAAAAAPVANFTSVPTGLTVQFTDTSTNTPTARAWYFGDEDYAGAWTQMTAAAEWSNRTNQNSVALPDGSIVLMGGYSSVFHNDTWRSTNNGASWTQMTAGAEWSNRSLFSSVVLPDGSIVLMGGEYNGEPKNDVWRSTNNGASWTQMTPNAEWGIRYSFSSVALPDGSIVLMGGYDGSSLNDTWRSTNNGASWTQMTPNAEWMGRYAHRSVVFPDGSIVLMGGYNDTLSLYLNDVWRSTNNGASWTQMTPNAGWSVRESHSSVAMPDGSIVLTGGTTTGSLNLNDVWRSTNNGTSWTQLTASAEWMNRAGHSSVAMPDGSIVLIGGRDAGGDFLNDTWRFMPAGSSATNPPHTYTTPGTYHVVLQASNADGFSRKAADVTVTEGTGGSGNGTIGVYRNGVFYLRNTNTGGVADNTFIYGQAGDVPVVGNWTGSGTDTIGVYRNGVFYLRNSNTGGVADNTFIYGQAGDVPVVGDWTGSGTDTIGVYRNGVFYLRNTNTGGVADNTFIYGQAGDVPVVWHHDGIDTIGVYRNGVFYLRNTNTGGVADNTFIYGQAGDVPVVGAWT